MLLEDSPNGIEKLNEALETIRAAVPRWDEKRALILANWLIRKMEYLESEGCYQPKRDNYYKRGQIVHVDFGFNVGSEDGGGRFAVVLWSPQDSKTMTVIPLTSCSINNPDDRRSQKNKCNEKKISSFPLHVDLGELLTRGTKTIAKVEQIRAISKLRVSRINKSDYRRDRVPGPLLDKINEAILVYTKKS